MGVRKFTDSYGRRAWASTHVDVVVGAEGGTLGQMIPKGTNKDNQLINKSELDAKSDTKQDTLVSGENIKTINGESIIGSGGIIISGETIQVDAVPTKNSPNPVNSGGVFNELVLGNVYDVSAHNDRATFASLSALLSDANLDTLIPTDVRKGGMSIKFVQTSDNKYVQYRLMSPTWSTNAANWQGVTTKLDFNSQDIPTSDTVEKGFWVGEPDTVIDLSNYTELDYFINGENDKWVSTQNYKCKLVPITGGQRYVVKNSDAVPILYALLTTNSHTANTNASYATGCGRVKLPAGDENNVLAPANAQYLFVSTYMTPNVLNPLVAQFNKHDIRVLDSVPVSGSKSPVESGGLFDVTDKINAVLGEKLSYFGKYIGNTSTGELTNASGNNNGFIISANSQTKYLFIGSVSIELTQAGCYSDYPSEDSFLGLCSNNGYAITTLENTKFVVINTYVSHGAIYICGVNTLQQSNLQRQESFVVCNTDRYVSNKEIENNNNLINKDLFFCKFTYTHLGTGDVTLTVKDNARGNISAPLYYNGNPLNNSDNCYSAGDVVLVSYNRSANRFDTYSLSKIDKLIANGTINTSKLADSAVTTDKIANSSVSKPKMAYDPLDELAEYGRPDNIIVGLAGYNEQVLSIIRAFVKDVTVTNVPQGYTKGCVRVRQIYCARKTSSLIELSIQFGTIIGSNNTLSNVGTIEFTMYSTGTIVTKEGGIYKVVIDMNNWALKDSFSSGQALFYDNSKYNHYSVIATNDIKTINGKALEDGSVDYNKLSQEIKDDIVTAEGFLYKKKIVTLCDSMGASSQWQTPLAKLTGCVYDKSLNDNHYSVGGTKTLFAPQMGNDAQGRAIKLVEEQLIDPDVIIYQNVNDNEGLQVGTNSDEPFMKTQQLTISTPSILSSEADAETYWTDNFSTIVGEYTPQAGTILGIPFTTNNGVKLKLTGSASANGTLSISLTQAGTLSIAVSAGDSIAAIISKILEYDWNGYTDIVDPEDNDAVIFTKLDGTTPAVFSVDAGTTGITYTTNTGVTGNLYMWKYFYGHDLSKWSDATYWVDSITKWSMWKGIIEYLQTHFPKAMIYWMAPQTFTFDYNNLSGDQVYPDGTPNYYYIWEHNITYGALRNQQRAFCTAYHIPFIELVNNSGINPMNASYFCNVNNVHPKTTAYYRWAEILAQQLN